MLRQAKERPFGKSLALRVDGADAASLRDLADKLRDKIAPAVVLLAAEHAGKVALVLTVSKELNDRFKAGELIKGVAATVGGSGGGRPDMAQAGGTDVSKLDEALRGLDAKLDQMTA
jgi:alanyl-tRNA synthetase